MLGQFLQKFDPELPLHRACEIMQSPHATFDAVVNDETEEVVGGILYMSFEECRFSIIGVLGGEGEQEALGDVPMYDAIYAPFEFSGAKEVLKGWWRKGSEDFDMKDVVCPLFIYFNAFLLVDDVLGCKEFCDMVAPIYAS